MLTKGNTLHFINRLDSSNCGDLNVSPLQYYSDFFSQYSLKRNDIRFIDYSSIAPNDVVILGGGGLFDYSECLNRAINRLLNTGAAVIAWAPGLNTHTDYDGTFSTKIEFEKFTRVTVRNYPNPYGIEYLPDVSCKHPGLKADYKILRKYGVAMHKDYDIPSLAAYDKITNSCCIDDVLRFIGETEIVFSNSFHMIYWSLLMGKKTICVDPVSSRFSYKYKPAFYHTVTDDISECVAAAKSYDIIDECIAANDSFFNYVKKIIEKKLSPVGCAIDNITYATDTALLSECFRETMFLPGDNLTSQLFVDTGSGFTEQQKRIAINNVLGDQQSVVRYDLSGYDHVKQLRFDPLEGHFCDVEIFSAADADGEVHLVPCDSVRIGSKDRFLTTDPQYIPERPCREFLEIRFCVETISRFDAEQNIKRHFHAKENQLGEMSHNIASLHKEADKLKELVSEKDNDISSFSKQCKKLAGENEQLEQIIIERNNRISSFREQCEKLAGENEQLGQTIHDLNEAILRSEAVAHKQEQLIIQHRNTIEQQTAVIEQTRTELDKLYNSISWKITSPMRKAAAFFMRIVKGNK